MATVEYRIDSTDNIGCFIKEDNDYFTARNANNADSIQESMVNIGQKFTTPKYSIYRGVFSWDTSGLDDNCLIVSATITLYQYTGLNEITAIVKSGMATYPHRPAVVGDYDLDHYSGNGAEVENYNNGVITLNSTGRNWINKTGYTKLIVLCSNDVDGLAPSASEAIYLYGYAVGANETKRPLLTVEYALPTGSPSVSAVEPCTDKQSTTMTAIGNVTDDGGGYEARGFEYYEDSSVYASEMWAVREKGVFVGTGNFEMTINGLKPETTYQIRPWLKNIFGLVYGDWYTCTTTAVPEYGMFEEDNSPTIIFYLSEDDGMTWGQKHGPYTESQADIEITKLLVRGSGKKKIKFESDVLTGISASVLVKLDCKAR